MGHILFIILLMGSTFAWAETFQLPKARPFKIEIPAGWKAAPNLFGIPLAILGPQSQEKRPVLSVYPGELHSKTISEEKLQSLFVDFKKEKEQWMKEEGGELKSFEPLTKVNFSKAVRGHYIGAEYVLNKEHFLERSYYLYCQGELFNLKYTFRSDQLAHLQAALKMVENFTCD
jgi:hypothetical protein